MSDYDNGYKAGMYYGKRKAAEETGYKEAYLALLEKIVKNEALLPQQVILTISQRTWVGLTDDERLEAAEIDGADEWFWKVCKAIEAKLKEKNT